MKRERLWGTLRQVWLRARPFLVSALAVVLIVLQQIYYLDDPASVVLNIILLGLNLLLFVPLIRNAGKAAAHSGDTVDRVLQWVGLVFVSLLGFLYNIFFCGVPSPLSDFQRFFNSMCGLWTAAVLMEFLLLGGLACARRLQFSRPGRAIVVPPYPGGPEGPDIPSGEEPEGPGGTGDTGGSEGAGGTGIDAAFGKKLLVPENVGFCAFLILYLHCFLFLPFLNLTQFTWIDSVKEFVKLLLGDSEFLNHSNIIALVFYALALFALFFTAIVIFAIARYVLKCFSGNGDRPNFFDEYGTSVVILIMIVPFLLSVQQVGTDGYQLVGFVSSLFGYTLGILVGIIAVMVAFEAIRLILKQCLQHGSLLKISMRLVFVLIVQYSMGLLMGVLRMFALRSVLESLLLFFLPDLGDSLEPEVTQVMNEALEREIEMTSGGLQHRYGEHQPRISRKDKVVIRRIGTRSERKRRGSGWIRRTR